MKKNYLFLISFIFLIQFCRAQNTWAPKAPIGGMVRMGAVSFSINDKGYLGTGGDFVGAYYDDFWQYDPVTDTWTQKANFPGSVRYRSLGFGTTTKGYI